MLLFETSSYIKNAKSKNNMYRAASIVGQSDLNHLYSKEKDQVPLQSKFFPANFFFVFRICTSKE